MTSEQQQVVGLAAALQSLALVNEVAFNGDCDKNLSQTTLEALLVYNPDEAISAYGDDVHNLRYGLSVLEKMLLNQTVSELAKYLIPAMVIELKLVRNEQLLNTVRQDLMQASNVINQYNQEQEDLKESHANSKDDDSENDEDFDEENYFAPESTYLIDNSEHMQLLASAYKRNISGIEPRIMIKGNSQFLQEEVHANRIRALLFAALRGISFYRHNGGTRLGLLTSKAKILANIADFK